MIYEVTHKEKYCLDDKVFRFKTAEELIEKYPTEQSELFRGIEDLPEVGDDSKLILYNHNVMLRVVALDV